jgi:uncharacterized damage-inducible protein DinB
MAITRPYLVSMAAYNGWMNGKIYEAAARLSPEEIARDRGAFFKSILGTLNHLLFADLIWIGRFKEGRPRVTDPDAIRHGDLKSLPSARTALDGEIQEWAGSIDEAWLARTLTFKSVLGDTVFTFPAWMMVVHMFNHQTHHRGQITTLLTQASQDVGATDFIALPGLTDLAISA